MPLSKGLLNEFYSRTCLGISHASGTCLGISHASGTCLGISHASALVNT